MTLGDFKGEDQKRSRNKRQTKLCKPTRWSVMLCRTLSPYDAFPLTRHEDGKDQCWCSDLKQTARAQHRAHTASCVERNIPHSFAQVVRSQTAPTPRRRTLMPLRLQDLPIVVTVQKGRISDLWFQDWCAAVIKPCSSVSEGHCCSKPSEVVAQKIYRVDE